MLVCFCRVFIYYLKLCYLNLYKFIQQDIENSERCSVVILWLPLSVVLNWQACDLSVSSLPGDEYSVARLQWALQDLPSKR